MPQICGVAQKSKTFYILVIFYWKDNKATLRYFQVQYSFDHNCIYTTYDVINVLQNSGNI